MKMKAKVNKKFEARTRWNRIFALKNPPGALGGRLNWNVNIVIAWSVNSQMLQMFNQASMAARKYKERLGRGRWISEIWWHRRNLRIQKVKGNEIWMTFLTRQGCWCLHGVERWRLLRKKSWRNGFVGHGKLPRGVIATNVFSSLILFESLGRRNSNNYLYA